MTIIWSDRFADHATGSHPERPERIQALKAALDAAGVFAANQTHDPTPASVEAIERIHAPQLIELVLQTAGSGGGWLDPDTYVSPASYEVALLAAGAVTQALEAALAGAPAFAFVRPPGHHAEPRRAMGFCLFNSVAVAVEEIRARHGVERVAILDWDVHHGNGTQAAFWTDPDVLFVSLHQYPFYPGTGAAAETGAGAGEGATLNIPLAAGCDDAVYQRCMEEQALPAIADFAPELVVVSAGFDAHRDDPLANMQVSTEGFRWMAGAVAELALEHCDGRLALALEGGYNLQSLGASAVATIEEIRARYGMGEQG